MNDLLFETTEDALLNGKLRLRQPRSGHRAGHDAILLAAATAARSSQRVVDLGAGVGTAGLAVAQRVKGISLQLVEIDPRLADLARSNADANHIPAEVIVLDVVSRSETFEAAGLSPDSVDLVLMNPPFNDASRHRSSPDSAREAAHVATSTTLTDWIHAARRLLKSGGVLTMIWRADGLADVVGAVQRGFGSLVIQPIHSEPGASAIRIIVRAVKGGRAPLKLLSSLTLRDPNGAPDPFIEQVLRGQAVLSLAEL
jgi:tRNA1(Val) A37 N6-methylase TrmN6